MKSRNFIPFKKYKNKTCYVDGIRFDSRLEAAYYGQLKIEKRARLIKDFERQVSFTLIVDGKTICHHRVDFLVTLNDGSKEIREVKGYETAAWDIKRKLFEVVYPDIRYKVIK